MAVQTKMRPCNWKQPAAAFTNYPTGDNSISPSEFIPFLIAVHNQHNHFTTISIPFAQTSGGQKELSMYPWHERTDGRTDTASYRDASRI